LDIGSLYGSQLELLPSDNLYKLNSPIAQNNFNIFLSNLPIKVSGCVLPGMDFRINQCKVCQDEYAVVVHNHTLLAILCDGHGSEGHYIARFAVEYMSKYFKKHCAKFLHDPKAMIATLMQKCDRKILDNMECDLSGTTAIVLFIDAGRVYCGSVGDSRAVMGSMCPTPDIPKQRNNNKYYRKISCDNSFRSWPLTQDQKPENTEEMMRIKVSGGLVERYTDAFGRSVGPFRVWSKDGTGPGLAMSRSLGDKVAKRCGVISVPLFQDVLIGPSIDYYVVIASDGLWDVFENIEVINFVDSWKNKCAAQATDEYPAAARNCTISRLLCEEARYRWLGVAQQERIAIDDISCVIIDFAVKDTKESVLESEKEKKLVKIDSPSGSIRNEDE
jgi:serine/threonine protein phosphatase PrpC